MSCIKRLGRYIDWGKVNEGRERDRCATLQERDGFLADKTSAFARIVPARAPVYHDRGGV